MAEDNLAKFIVDDVFTWLKDERNSQLEDQWRRNYDAFRGRYNSDVLRRWKASEGNDWRSKVFVRFTKQRVMAGYASMTALMLRGGQLPWDIKPSVLPDNYQGLRLTDEEAEFRCGLMKKQLQDDFANSKADRVVGMTSTLEGMLYGLSWIHTPVLRPKNRIKVNFSVPGMDSMNIPPEIASQYGRFYIQPDRQVFPMVENPVIWSVFWDMEYPDPNQGQGIILRDLMSKGRFSMLLDDPAYDRKAVKEVLAQFPQMSGEQSNDGGGSEELDDSAGPVLEKFGKNLRVIPVFLYYGRVPTDKLMDYSKRRGSETEIRGLDSRRGYRETEIVCVVAKGMGEAKVISKPIINPFPYRPLKMAKHEELPNEAGGVGLPENVEDSQMIINGLTRAMLDNKALATNLLTVHNPSSLMPGQNMTLYPGKSFATHEGIADVRTALNWYSPPDITGNTPGLIEMFRDFFDEESGVPRSLAGQVSDTKRTAFELSKVAEAANKLQGMLIRNKDEGHIEPLVTCQYHYHMLANPDEQIKGDFEPVATGFQSYQDKAVRGQVLMQMLQFSISNAFTAQFTKVLPFIREICKTADLDPDKFYPSDDELQQGTELLARQLPALPNGTTEGEIVNAGPGGVGPLG